MVFPVPESGFFGDMPFCVSIRRGTPPATAWPSPLINAGGRNGAKRPRLPLRGSWHGEAVTEEAFPAARDSPCHFVALPPHKCGGQGGRFSFHNVGKDASTSVKRCGFHGTQSNQPSPSARAPQKYDAVGKETLVLFSENLPGTFPASKMYWQLYSRLLLLSSQIDYRTGWRRALLSNAIPL